MKKYITPKVIKMEFDYTNIIITSNVGGHGDQGHGHGCGNNSPKTAHPVFGGC